MRCPRVAAAGGNPTAAEVADALGPPAGSAALERQRQPLPNPRGAVALPIVGGR